jgi:hypothetical protein
MPTAPFPPILLRRFFVVVLLLLPPRDEVRRRSYEEDEGHTKKKIIRRRWSYEEEEHTTKQNLRRRRTYDDEEHTKKKNIRRRRTYEEEHTKQKKKRQGTGRGKKHMSRRKEGRKEGRKGVGKTKGRRVGKKNHRIYREKFEADAEWYPGKPDEDAKAPGRKKVITKAQENAIASSAMAMKERGLVPSVSAIIAQCPKATLNPETEEPFTAKVILEVFRSSCYDKDPEHPWSYQNPKHKTALTPELEALRAKWGFVMLDFNHHAGWYHRHVLWMDPCYTIVPGRPKTIFDQQQFNFGKSKRWMSSDSKDLSLNQRTSPYTNKTTQWGDEKVWWFMILAKGKVRIHVVGKDWHQDPKGQAQVPLPPFSLCHPTPRSPFSLPP